MSNQGWNNGQGGYPQGGQGGYNPQGGQGGYPQGGQGGYNPQQGQGGGYQGNQGGFAQGGQGGYAQQPQGQYGNGGGYPPAGGAPTGGGGGSKLPFIIGGAILLIGIIGVVIYFLTRGDSTPTTETTSSSSTSQSADPKPSATDPVESATPADPEPSTTQPGEDPSPTEPGEDPSATEPALPEDQEIALEDVPAKVGEWEASSSFGGIRYSNGSTYTLLTSVGDSMDLKSWGLGMENKVEGAGGKAICGTVVDIPLCYLEGGKYGVFQLVSIDDTTPEDLLPLAAGIVEG